MSVVSPAARRPDRAGGSGQRTSATRLLPGLALAGAVATAATGLGRAVPIVGAPVFAIVAGIVITAVRRPGAAVTPGLDFTAKQVLQGSIMVLGLNLSLHQVVSAGTSSLPVLVGTLTIALVVAWAAGRALRLRSDLNTLIGVGSAICGASAIAATDAVIGAAEADVAYAIATIFTFNVVAVVTYPALGHLIGMSQHSFGLWAGTAINDTSSVVAASTVYGHAAASYGVVVKLTRTLAIIPICLALAAWRNRRGVAEGSAADLPPVRLHLAHVVPVFIFGFVGAVVANTAGLVPSGWHHALSDAATWMITAALAAIGLSTRVDRIRRAGPRPLVLGALLWATVAISSLGLQAATGSL
ncbi:MAG: YeiH family protein [Acidimicrobiales bacterium]